MKSLLAALLLAISAVASTAQAAFLYVPSQYPTIQGAVDAAEVGDVIVVAEGIYDDNSNQSSPTDTTRCVVRMKAGITIRGAGIGSTIIDAVGRGRGIHCEGVTTGTIEHLSIRGADANHYGAGILCYSGSSLVLSNLEIADNEDAALVIMDYSSPQIISCRVVRNNSKQGGGISIENDSNPFFYDCLISGNHAPVGGGAFVRNGCSVVFDYCTISGNQLDSPNASGGGMAIVNATVAMTNSLIEGNFGSGSGGGVAILDFSTFTAENTKIIGNSTSDNNGSGGGVYLEFAFASFTDCTIADNTTAGVGAEGAAVHAVFAMQLDMTRCTLANNTATDPSVVGGGIVSSYSNPTIQKCIIANNSGKGLLCLDGSVPVVSCSNIYGNPGGNAICGTDAGGNFSLDPMFCDAANGDYHLQEESPCAPGQHPAGETACDGDRIGSMDVGCDPVSIDQHVEALRNVALWSEPNPGIGGTAMRFMLSDPAIVNLSIHDVAGREVRALTDGFTGAGLHSVSWDGRCNSGNQVPAGVYFGRITVGGSQAATHRLVLVR